MTTVPATVSVAIGQWAVAAAPSKIRTLLGSCVGVVLYDRAGRVGGLAHIVLPNSRGAVDHPGKYADTAIPGLIADLDRALRGKSAGRLVAKLTGGASMFTLRGRILALKHDHEHRPNQSRGRRADPVRPSHPRDRPRPRRPTGRHVTLDTATGLVLVRAPGAEEKEL